MLSEIEVAGPALIQAALEGNEGQKVTAAGRILEVDEVDPDDPAIVVTLCDVEHPTEVFPPREALTGHVLALVDRASVTTGARGALPAAVAQFHTDRQPKQRASGAGGSGRRSRTSRGGRGCCWPRSSRCSSIGTSVFALSKHLDVIDAMYFTATTMATVGYGDVNLLEAPDWLKLFDIGLMAVSAVLLASVLAIVTDQLVSQRIDRALGRFPRPKRDHVIVCGLGKAGARVITGLHELGIPCVAVERNPEAVGIAIARRLEIPVVFGDGRTPGILNHAAHRTPRAP